MILIADSGSTKTEWKMIEDNSEFSSCITSGINPFFLGEEEILQIMKSEFTFPKEKVDAIFFYGAGCALPEKKRVLYNALQAYFGINSIEIQSDLIAAARSLCQDTPGIVCILGTGSNSCYYDGKEIVHNVSPLGYILGDEGSGAVLGKKLLADILKNQVGKEITDDFFSTYSVTAGEILEHVYRKPFPNRYLAQYTRFIAKHVEKTEIKLLLETSFSEFVERNLLQYENVQQLPIHFTGSVAFYFRTNLGKVIRKYGLQLGSISQSPMDGLILYHNVKKKQIPNS